MAGSHTAAQPLPGGGKSAYGWLVVGLLFPAACLNYADRGALNAVFPLLRRDLGMSDLALGATGSLFLWSYAVLSPFAGMAGDRYSRSRVIAWSLAAWSAVTMATGLVSSQGQLLATRVLLGAAESLYVPTSIALIADHHSGATRAKALSVHLCGFYAGVVAGGGLSGYMGERFGWRVPLFALGGAGLALSAVLSRYLRDVPKQTADPGSTESPYDARRFAFLRIPSYHVLVTDAFLLAIITHILLVWLPLYLHETFAVDLGSAGFEGAAPIQAGSILGVLLGGALSDQVGKRSRRRRMLVQTACALLSAPLLLTFLVAARPATIYAALFSFALIRYLGGANASPLICELIPPDRRSAAFGFMNLMNCLAAGTGVFVAGALKGVLGLRPVFAFASGIGLLAGLILLSGYRLFLTRDLQRAAAEAEP